MPALKAIMEGDSTPLQKELAKVEAIANGSARRMSSTIFNPKQTVTADASYADFWAKSLKEQEIAAAAAAKEYVIVSDGMHMAGEAAKKSSVPMKLLTKELDYATHGAGTFAKIIIGSFKNPVMWAIGAIIGILYGLKKAFDVLAPHEDTLGVQTITRGFDKFGEAAMRSKIALQTWFDELRRGRTEVDKLQDSMRDAINTNEAWAKSDQQKADAEKDLALAQLERDKATGKITGKDYNKKKQELEDKAEEETMNRQRELRNKNTHEMHVTAEKAEEKHKEVLSGIAEKASKADAANKLKDDNEARMTSLKETIKDLDKQHREAKGGEDKLRAGNALRYYRGLYDEAAEAQPGLAQDAAQKESDLKRAQNDAAGLKKQAEDLRRQASAQGVQDTAQNAADKAKLAADKQRRDVERQMADLHGENLRGSVSNLQRIGGYIGPTGNNSLLAVNKDIHKEIKGLRSDIKECNKPGARPPLGGVVY